MKSRLINVCCVLLTMALLLQMLPVQALGTQNTVVTLEDATLKETAQDNSLETSSGEETIINEIVDRRTKFSKEYLLSNGFSLVIVYPEAVHYKENNAWEEINNTLKSVGSGTNARYVNTAGEWTVSFPQQISDKKFVTINRDGYTLSFGLAGKLSIPDRSNVSTMDLGQIGDQATSQLAVDFGNDSNAVIENLDFTAMRESMEYPETFVDTIFSQLRYNNVYNNTDVVYDLNSKQVKESIVIETYDPKLYGYQYTLNTGTMVPVLGDDGSITLYSPDYSEIVMTMPAPYMIDGAGAINYDVGVTLEANGSGYTLAYHIPTDWLADKTRVWPVVLDPVVVATSEANNILDKTIMENYALSHTSGALFVGYETSNGKMWTFLKYVGLPEFSSGDVIVKADVSLYRYDGTNGTTTIEAHKVMNTWTSSEITWANQPAHDPTVEDYTHVNGTGRYSWDITDIARGWYEGVNTGLMFKATDAVETGNANNWKKFYSIDYSIYATDWWPYLSITYRNSSGLENYWDYTANGAGRAGTGYVNNYTGNLVWVRNDLGFGGTRMPVSISHIYNSDDSASNNYGIGYGWKTNFHQTLQIAGEGNNPPYVWEDGDGTDHYFISDSATNIYKDEDGLELTLTVTGNSKIITDKYGNKSYFNAAGNLTKQENNQQTASIIEIIYSEDTDSPVIETIKDGVGRVYNFEYTNGLLSKITYFGKGTTEISSVSYAYSGKLLTRITDKDGESNTFGYTGNNLLSEVRDVDGYRLVYSYTAGSPKRVASISEYQGVGTGTPGGSLTIAYAHNQTTIKDHNNNVQIMQFNDWGNTICIQDSEGRAQYAQYAANKHLETNQKRNQLIRSSKLQNTVGNMIYENSFENGLPWGTNTPDLQISRTSEQAYFGGNSLKAVINVANPGSGAYSPGFYLAPGETVTVSAYVKNPDGPAHLAIHHNDGVNYYTFPGEELPASEDWVRTEVTYTNTFGYTVSACAYLFTPSAGTYYLDGVQVEKAATASRFNLVDNGDFRNGYYGWTGNAGSLVTLGCSAVPGLDSNVYMVVGSPSASQILSQTINQSGAAGDCYVFAGWAKGNAVPITDNSRAFGMRLIFNNTDGSQTVTYASFNTDLPTDGNWQYLSAPAVSHKAYSSITVQTVYDYGANTIYFDGIQVYKEIFGNTYTYDDKGNVTSAVDLQNQITSYEYDTQTNNLMRIIQDNKAKVTYTYDNWHNVKTATTEEGVVYGFEYDTYGNNTEVKIDNGHIAIRNAATYTPDGNRMLTSTDDLANVTTYCYNEDTNVLEWVQYPKDTEASRTTYTYDEMHRLIQATKQVSGLSTGTELFVDYMYDGDLIFAIDTNTEGYCIDYGDFGQRLSICVEAGTLATYDYTDDQNRYLNSITYGNYDSVHYTYDHLGRVIQETFEDDTTVCYAYDNTGALATVTDSATGRKTSYYYDLTNRLMKYVESSTGYSHSVQYNYDGLNNLSWLAETINGEKHTTAYTYDDDNRLTEINYAELANGNDVSQTFTYDVYGRPQFVEIINGNDRVYYSWYQYVYANVVCDTAHIEGIQFVGNRDVLNCYYTYDSNGNITNYYMPYGGEITRSGNNYYHYDTANQLIREDNQWLGKTFVWTYDNAGNITSSKEYPYTNRLQAVSGTPVKTNTYTYDLSGWGDVLTAYNGVQWSYDQIGNLIYDGTWGYTWQNGRELASMCNSSTNWNYTYDANGMRTSRSNGTKTYNYVYNGSQLTQMTVGDDTLYFTYGAFGPTTVTWNGVTYYYALNAQGDVMAIFDGTGACVVVYNWDNAWGYNPEPQGSMAATLGTLNPLRYRSYVYDQETGLYYLQSRYYNPAIGRFINADAFVSTGQGLLGNNMFAYCLNNPVNYVDYSGGMSCINQMSTYDSGKPIGNYAYELYKNLEDSYSAAGITLYSTEWSALMDWRNTYLPLSAEYEHAAYLYSIETSLGTRFYFSNTYRGSKGGGIISPNVIIPTIILEVSDCFTGGNLVAQVHSHPMSLTGHNDYPSYAPNIYGGDRIAYELFGYQEMYIIPYMRCLHTPMVIAISDRSTWCAKHPH